MSITDGGGPFALPGTASQSPDTVYLADIGAEVPMALFRDDLDAARYMVDRWYEELPMDRDPDSATSRDYWAQLILTDGATVAREQFVGTPEFQQKRQEDVDCHAWLMSQASKPAVS